MYEIVNSDVDNHMMTAVRSAVMVIEEAFNTYKLVDIFGLFGDGYVSCCLRNTGWVVMMFM